MILFVKPCRVCDQAFRPTGKYSKLCENCGGKIKMKRRRRATITKRENPIYKKRKLLKEKRTVGKWIYTYKTKKGVIDIDSRYLDTDSRYSSLQFMLEWEGIKETFDSRIDAGKRASALLFESNEKEVKKK